MDVCHAEVCQRLHHIHHRRKDRVRMSRWCINQWPEQVHRWSSLGTSSRLPSELAKVMHIIIFYQAESVDRYSVQTQGSLFYFKTYLGHRSIALSMKMFKLMAILLNNSI